MPHSHYMRGYKAAFAAAGLVPTSVTKEASTPPPYSAENPYYVGIVDKPSMKRQLISRGSGALGGAALGGSLGMLGAQLTDNDKMMPAAGGLGALLGGVAGGALSAPEDLGYTMVLPDPEGFANDILSGPSTEEDHLLAQKILENLKHNAALSPTKEASLLRRGAREAWNIAKSPVALAGNVASEGMGRLTRRLAPDDVKSRRLADMIAEEAPGSTDKLRKMYTDMGLDVDTATVGESVDAGIKANRRSAGKNALRASALGAGGYGVHKYRESNKPKSPLRHLPGYTG